MISNKSTRTGRTEKKDYSESLKRFIEHFGIEAEKTGLFTEEFVWMKKFFCRLNKNVGEISKNRLDETFFAGESFAIYEDKLIPTLKLLEVL